MALVVIYNYYDGFHEQLVRNVIRYKSGHLEVTAPVLRTATPAEFYPEPFHR